MEDNKTWLESLDAEFCHLEEGQVPLDRSGAEFKRLRLQKAAKQKKVGKYKQKGVENE